VSLGIYTIEGTLSVKRSTCFLLSISAQENFEKLVLSEPGGDCSKVPNVVIIIATLAISR